ncbi:MAG TPA: AAA family ATPase [Pseudothermotoga sp.]
MNIFITGMTGTGKTTLAGYLLSTAEKPIFGFTNKEEDIKVIESTSGKIFRRIHVTDRTYLKHLPDDRNVFFVWSFIEQRNKLKFMDRFANMCMQKTNKLIYIDEAHEVLGEGQTYSKRLEALISGGRIKKLDVIVITQRPQNVIKSVLNNCRYKIVFKLNEPNAIMSMKKNLDGKAEIEKLELYSYLVYDAYSGEYEINRPIKLPSVEYVIK